MTLNCLIVDDEPLARRQIEDYVEQVPFLKLTGSVRNPAIAKKVVESEPVDLIFLDIRMPQVTGIEFLRENQIFQQVIFITAYPEYAIDGFELEVTDYLMKPVTFERFLKAAEKAAAKVNGSESIKAVGQHPEFLFVKHNQRFEKVAIADILLIESMLNYIILHTEQGKFTVYSSLKNIEDILPGGQFLRVHKSFIVSKQKIKAVAAQEVQIGDRLIPLSKTYKDEVWDAALKTGLRIG